MLEIIASFIKQAIIQGIPLLYGSTGEILTEKSGNLNLGIPGIMYIGGISGVIGAYFYEKAVVDINPFLCVMIPLLCSILGSVLMALIYCFLTVTLRANQRQWYYERLDERFPGLREKYEETYGERYDCASPRAAELYAVLEDACRERGVLLHMPEIIAASRKPYGVQQLSLF